MPIIHTESDLGSTASGIDAESVSRYGQERWATHKDTVVKFWANLERYLSTIDASNLKIYQDGLPADGEIGRRIVEEAARRGSANYRIILSLMKRGAEIRKTEDRSHLEEEYRYIAELIRPKPAAEKVGPQVNYKLRKNRLTAERDKFVAKTIGETLKNGETGLLFMGSYHNVLSYLPTDIVVHQVKGRDKVNAYFKELGAGASSERLEQLAACLASPCMD